MLELAYRNFCVSVGKRLDNKFYTDHFVCKWSTGFHWGKPKPYEKYYCSINAILLFHQFSSETFVGNNLKLFHFVSAGHLNSGTETSALQLRFFSKELMRNHMRNIILSFLKKTLDLISSESISFKDLLPKSYLFLSAIQNKLLPRSIKILPRWKICSKVPYHRRLAHSFPQQETKRCCEVFVYNRSIMIHQKFIK